MKLFNVSHWYPVRLLGRYIKAHHISGAALIVAGVSAALLFFAVGACVRLLIGPVSLGPFAGTLANALAKALPGMTVKYDQAAVEWARDEGKVNLVILGTRVFDADGRIIAQAPKADVDLAAAPILHGDIVVKRIALVGVQLTLVRTANGMLRLGVGKDKQESDLLERISEALKTNDGSTSSLEGFAIRNARLAFLDEATGLFLIAPQASLHLAKAGDNLDAKIDALVEISGRPAHAAADIAFPSRGGIIRGTISVTGFEVGALADNSKTFAAVRNTALKVDLSASFSFKDSHLLATNFRADGAGAFALPGVKDSRLRVSNLHVAGRYDGSSGRLSIEDAAIDSDKIKAHLNGKVDLAIDAAGALTSARADVRMDTLSLAWPGFLAEPVLLQFVDLRGAWIPATRDVIVEHLGVSGAPISLEAAGKITLAEGRSPGIEVKGTLAPIGVRDVVRHWPLTAASGAREWVNENMLAGTIGPASFEMQFPVGALDEPALPAGALNVKFAVNGGEINYIRGLTHLTQVQGTAVVTGDTFTADISGAKIGPLAVTAAKFAIPNLNAADEAGEISGHIQGTMGNVLALVDLPPLGYPTRFGIKPGEAKGSVGLDLSFRVPMRRAVSVNDIGIAIKADVSGFAVALGPHTRMTDGTLSIAIGNDELHAAGTAGIGGSASHVTVDWVEDFRTASATTTRIAVKGTLDEQARTALGMHAKDYLKGPIGINGTLTGHRGALQQANVALDLTPATLTLDLIGLSKPAGFPTSARVVANFGPHSALLTETFRVTGPGTAVTANAKFDDDGHLIELLASPARIGPLDDFSLNLTRGSAGVEIVLRGHSLDGSRLARRGSGASGSDDNIDEPYHINAKLDRLVLRDGVAIAPFSLDLFGVSDRPTSLAVAGSLSKTATVTGSIVATDSGRRATFAIGDMGLLTRGLFGFNSMRGGNFDFAATLPGKAGDAAPKDPNAPDFQGQMTLKDFRVVDQPFLARLFSAGSLGGLINLMQGQGIAVDMLEVPFASRNGVISVHDVRATGPAIGISADGYVDRPKNGIALKGSLVPMFGLNSVLGNIPLLGDVLTSKQGEGVIGVTYSVSGNADEPSVSVNPLSALAPGILRRIFEGKMPNAAQAQSNMLKLVAPKAALPAPKPRPASKPAPKRQ